VVGTPILDIDVEVILFAMTRSTPDAPLAGLTVISFEQAVAAPYCTRLLADLGARVIKVEQPGSGDFSRGFDDVADGLATHFVWLNRNKESVTLDLKNADVTEVLDRLLEKADIVVQNLAPGAARRLGIDATTLLARFPRIVAVDMSGYGTGGPLEHRRAYDLLAQAEAGSCWTTGWEGNPAKPGPPVADVGCGSHAAMSVLAAIIRRDRTGEGAAIEADLFDTVTDFLGFTLLHARYTGQNRPPLGMSSVVVAPYNGYPTRDGRTVVLGTTNDNEWQRLSRTLLGRDDLADDPAYATTPRRHEHREVLDEAIAAWTETLDLEEICARADAAGIGVAALSSPTDVVGHPQLVDRGRWQDVPSPVGPVHTLMPPTTSPQWETPLGGVPGLGEHTEAVLAELGFDADQYAKLHAAGAA